ncbi:Putative low molecular weight protein-tyrosine-phosphatase [Halomicronema hongdechloris C2206]|uniref:protein-tyrosine-phosphatase n=1 Tax=Halomicronema hongdechloris C2206 TaxID=1641165 RepID=A0A1Z3HRB9_9CYAN|nr:low molecular weight protein-tyrosine-phosphatase [Halomicronema hongdechloris]ASC72869.1 Putative low molecular weight protein-tyrosine-phosphatase [Halomicronema hongdechloris C2206]
MPVRLLFVCLGNICRSPSAENLMNRLLRERQLTNQVICDSAGTSAYHLGSPPDSRMAAAAAQRGLQLLGRARQIVPKDLQRFDWILAMDRQNYEDILTLDLSGQYWYKVKLMCDFCRRHGEQEVPDPYYGEVDGFHDVLELLEDACGGLLEVVVRESESVSAMPPS